MALNENKKNVAYTLGRTFAVLEAIQEEANPGINATIMIGILIRHVLHRHRFFQCYLSLGKQSY